MAERPKFFKKKTIKKTPAHANGRHIKNNYYMQHNFIFTTILEPILAIDTENYRLKYLH